MLKMSKFLTQFVVLFLVALAGMTGAARAVVEIDITKGKVEPLPIAIADFQSAAPLRQIADGIVEIVSSNLKNSGLFRPIEKAAFIQKVANIDTTPKFENWKLINAQALVAGRVMSADGDQLKVECRLWDVLGAKQMIGQQFFVTRDNWRRVAHIISDMIYERLVGEKGYFDSRIVYVEETGPKNKRVKRLAIMDQDGANVKILTKGSSLVLTPRFSPNRQKITYMSFEGGLPRVYLLQIETGQREIVGDFRGMTFAPRFSPDGKKIIMSLEKNGNANIYTMDLRSRRTTQLTDTVAIDTAPSYSPDGKRIVFESDRGGSQQLYVVNANDLSVQRISFGNGNYSTPVWSPRGDLIAFTKQSGGKFLIGVMKPDGSGERILTRGFHNEGPTWAPNGRVLMFFRETPGANGGPHLYSIDLTGYNERLVPTRSFASDPAWSPLLQ